MKARKTLVIHPILFVTYPVLFLYAHNESELSPMVVFRPLLVTVSVTFLLWGVLTLALKDRARAGLLVTLFAFLFFAFGHGATLFRLFTFSIGGVVIGHVKIAAAVWTVVFLAGAFACLRTREHPVYLTRALNAAGLLLCLLPLTTLTSHALAGLRASPGISSESIRTAAEKLTGDDRPPDIYYIILDAYARADILREIYGYDNSAFLDCLAQRGFYVATKSTSNYDQTFLSLASSLNMEYLDDAVRRIGVQSNARDPIAHMIHNSKVVRILKQHGYLFVAFASGYYFTEIADADVYKGESIPYQFDSLVLDMTPLSLLQHLQLSIIQYRHYRSGVLWTFGHLADNYESKAPKFVFAHIPAPHPPFVFRSDGTPITPDRSFSFGDGSYLIKEGGMTREEYVQKYREQLIFITSKTMNTVDAIMSQSKGSSVIVLQGDHGPRSLIDCEDEHNTDASMKEAFSILNACYLPNVGRRFLYNEISPVNTFRVIMNEYFGTNCALLDDRIFFSTWNHAYKFTDVTDRVRSGVDIEPKK